MDETPPSRERDPRIDRFVEIWIYALLLALLMAFGLAEWLENTSENGALIIPRVGLGMLIALPVVLVLGLRHIARRPREAEDGDEGSA
ncbi:hypothetical protein [Miltoncostaea oceani]|uniref:hypothetical protein n=1 Tax=Miltoncostaea oceani TaxID=2843216 RepID=UPI001FE51969|nr:hypothetical protein [Miltoncostaea oceani]